MPVHGRHNSDAIELYNKLKVENKMESTKSTHIGNSENKPEWMLTDDEIAAIKISEFPTGKNGLEKAIAKAQAKKLLDYLISKCASFSLDMIMQSELEQMLHDLEGLR